MPNAKTAFRILHFSDSHLGYQQYQFPERIVDFARVLDEVALAAITNHVDLVVDTGDTQHAPDPDPFSVAAYRRFHERLRDAGIPHLAIVGNHNFHEVGQKMEGNPSWMEAVSDTIIRPSRPETPIFIGGADNGIWVVAADWMPADQIDAFLARIPETTDALFMHQSMEGFMAAIMRPEMRPDQVDRKARYVGVGDVHINHRFVTPGGTLVGSAGSTEFCRADEPETKYCVIVTFFEDQRDILWEKIALRTRKVWNFPTAMSETSLALNLDVVLKGLATEPSSGNHYGYDNPLVILPYNRDLERQVRAWKARLQAEGCTMIKTVPESIVEADQAFEQIQTTSSNAMPEILAELLAKDPALLEAAVAAWNNPENLEAILASLKTRVRLDVTAAVPAPGA